jgi:plastocyanin
MPPDDAEQAHFDGPNPPRSAGGVRSEGARDPTLMHAPRLRTLAVGLGMFVAVGLFACGDGPPSSGTPAACNGTAAASSLGTATAANTIDATDNFVFVPDSTNASVGDVIEFKNMGTIVHTVTFQDSNDGCLTDPTLAPGATWQVKFTQPGTYNYLCTIHAPNMKGVIHITASGTAAPGATPSASATLSPAT